MPTLTDDAYLVAQLATAAVRGTGFPDPAAEPLLGATDMLHLHLVTLLVALGVAGLVAVWAVNIGSLAALVALVVRRVGTLPAAALLGFALWSHAVLVGTGAGLFLLLAWLAAWRFGRGDGGWWAGLAAGVRAEALPVAVLGAWARWRGGDRRWGLQAATGFLGVIGLNVVLWGSALPATLTAKRALLWRLSADAPPDPARFLWAAIPLLLLLWRGWAGPETRLLATAALLGVVWALLGTAPGAAAFLVGGLCWLAAAARAPRLGRWAAPALLALGLATIPRALAAAARWADHREVATRIAASLPADGCTLAPWYLGYLTAATDACVLDGSGFFDKTALAALRQTPTAEAARQAYGGRVAAMVQVHAPGVEPAARLGTWPQVARVRGRYLQAVLYARPEGGSK